MSKKTNQDLDKQIKDAAYYISQSNLSYDDLCWMLAELQLITQKGIHNVSDNDIRKKAEEISKLKYPVEKLHWQIAEINIKYK